MGPEVVMNGIETFKNTPKLVLDTTILGGRVDQLEIRLTSAEIEIESRLGMANIFSS